MNIIKEREKLDKLNGKLILKLFKALSIEPIEPQDNGERKYAYLRFSVEWKEVKLNFLGIARNRNRWDNYVLVIVSGYPYFKLLDSWKNYITKVGGEDFTEDPAVKLKWVMFAINQYIEKEAEECGEMVIKTLEIESILDQVNAQL